MKYGVEVLSRNTVTSDLAVSPIFQLGYREYDLTTDWRGGSFNNFRARPDVWC